ncbi:phosphotransferase enzyme family protein [Halomarina oriensis]|uniref:Phosphotransferase n=1 Tax=Halomarina oriensis TaxID=671145 RepID=A0A6B0GI33_9EURY|nr:aminoglycoside phosphotransferase family protein [Halomarina oriensis]MWG34404.1 phosphotransferase [Halomarina oriensis]
MTRDVSDALAQHTDQFTVDRQLHRVPPHVTHAVTVEGRRAVCKRATHESGDPATEAAVLRFVAEHTALPVPEVLWTGEDHFVAGWCDGLPGPVREDEAWARLAGAGLARLHDDTAGRFDRFGFPVATGVSGRGLALVGAGASWPETAALFLDRERRYLVENGYDEAATVAEEALVFARDHPEVFETPADPVCCHGNWLPDHVGVDDGRVTGVVDFEHALVAPPAFDVWRVALPVFGGEGGLDHRFEAFREGYESVRPLADRFEERAPTFSLLNFVSYFRSLYLQDQHDAAATARHAERFAGHVHATLGALRERVD